MLCSCLSSGSRSGFKKEAKQPFLLPLDPFLGLIPPRGEIINIVFFSLSSDRLGKGGEGLKTQTLLTKLADCRHKYSAHPSFPILATRQKESSPPSHQCPRLADAEGPF